MFKYLIITTSAAVLSSSQAMASDQQKDEPFGAPTQKTEQPTEDFLAKKKSAAKRLEDTKLARENAIKRVTETKTIDELNELQDKLAKEFDCHYLGNGTSFYQEIGLPNGLDYIRVAITKQKNKLRDEK